jgi:predicted Rossmann fold flavoprotein
MSAAEYDVLVIGAGPAGLMAAMAAAEAGCRVRVCERMAQPGRKLLATGGGRCNLTTTVDRETLVAAFGRQGRFLQDAVRAFDPAAIRAFFAGAGVPTLVQPDGCVFPVSQRARDVLDALLRQNARLGVTVQPECAVRAIRLSAGAVAGVETERGLLAVPRVILAAGGRGYPALGADGSGFDLAAGVGHTVVTPVPALVPLVTAETWTCELAGLVLEEACVRLEEPGRPPLEKRGPVLFTHRGISGPPVLDLSGAVAARLAATPALRDGVRLGLVPRAERDSAAWRACLEGWRTTAGSRLLHNLLAGELPRKLAASLCQQTGLTDTPAARLRREALETLARLCAAIPLTISRTEGWEQAMVTRGGVALPEVDPRTMASRRVPGLYFAGELLDLDGPCGGYNLTWAFASGRLAGRSAGGRVAGGRGQMF